jgi:hypothetical protein
MKSSKYEKLVNFKKNLNIPRHSWFEIKEGYSADLVNNLINDLKIKKESGYIFDPFSGSGTTALQSSILGFKSLGIEVNPFLFFLSKVKCINYSVKYEFYKKKFVNLNIEKLVPFKSPKLTISKKLFENQLEIILKIKNWIKNINDKNTRDLFFCAFLCSLDKCSYAKKDGNGLKYPKNKKPENFNKIFIDNINKFIYETKKIKILKNPFFYQGNCLEIIKQNSFVKKFKNKVSLCLFSPPYANCFDYTEVYKTELWFGDFIDEYKKLKKLRNLTLSSHLNKDLPDINTMNEIKLYINKIKKKNLWSPKIIRMIKNYFFEMSILLKNIYNLLNNNGKCVIVVGNSSYGNIVIPTDKILENISKKIGFKKTHIIEARRLGTSSQQYKNIDYPNKLRESLVILNKC